MTGTISALVFDSPSRIACATRCRSASPIACSIRIVHLALRRGYRTRSSHHHEPEAPPPPEKPPPNEPPEKPPPPPIPPPRDWEFAIWYKMAPITPRTAAQKIQAQPLDPRRMSEMIVKRPSPPITAGTMYSALERGRLGNFRSRAI